MVDPVDFDPALAGLWPAGAVRLARYGTGVDPGLGEAVGDVWLEVKAASEPGPAARLQALLNEMTDELKAQFVLFQAIRADAERKINSADEAELKIAKADLKAAVDALSLIIRTLEKIDSLQRSLARDLEIASEQTFSEADYAAMAADVERKISERAEERMRAWLAERDAAGTATGPPGI